jgi:hypothetical protein
VSLAHNDDPLVPRIIFSAGKHVHSLGKCVDPPTGQAFWQSSDGSWRRCPWPRRIASPNPTLSATPNLLDPLHTGIDCPYLVLGGGTVKGLFYLGNARDLLGKMRHDMQRLEQDHVDAYAAFDFFVTARHLPEWLYPQEKAKQKVLFEGSVLLRVCRRIADGSKHFEPWGPGKDSVKDTSLEGAAFDPRHFQSNAFQTGHLMIKLDGDAAETFGELVDVMDLAPQILRFWEEQPDLARKESGSG